MYPRVYDNGGATFDRYTVVIDGSIYGMSENPLFPNGFNQYCGEARDLPGIFTDCGKRVAFESLPRTVKKAIQERMKED